MRARTNIAKILCPIDGSEFSERALAWAVRLSSRFAASITALQVIPTPLWEGSTDPGVAYAVPADLLRVQREEVAEDLERFVAPLRGEGIAIHTLMLDGDPSRVIQSTAVGLPADLVVMGTHGRGGLEHLVLGSVTEKVLRRVTCPVLTVGKSVQSQHDGSSFRRILCALDLTEASTRTADLALCFAEEDMTLITLLHVLDGLPGQWGPPRYRALPDIIRIREEMHKKAEERLHRRVAEVVGDSCSMSERVEEGTPWREVLRVAKETEAELIVMGAHSLGTFGQVFFGSTVSHVVRDAKCPVLMVPEASARHRVPEDAPTVGASASPPTEVGS